MTQVFIGFDVDPEKDMDLEKARRNFTVPSFVLAESPFFSEKLYLETNPKA